MYDEHQAVCVTWNNMTKSWYENRGYVFTKNGDEFYVEAKDLPPTSHTHISIKCDYCGKIFTKAMSAVQKGRRNINKDCCSDCIGAKHVEITKLERAKKYISKVRKICEESGYTLLTDESEYTNQHMQIRFICPEHGVQSMVLENFLNRQMCARCSRKLKNGVRLDIDYIKKYIATDGNLLLNPEEYTRTTTRNLRIRCTCGNEYITSFDCYRWMNVHRCPVCSKRQSYPELIIDGVLRKYHICFEREKRFDDCRDKNPLPFDFFIPHLCTAIEYDGEHHYYPVRNDNKKFLKTKAHDKIKDEYCTAHHIRLIRIPYWDGDNIEPILIDKLKIES